MESTWEGKQVMMDGITARSEIITEAPEPHHRRDWSANVSIEPCCSHKLVVSEEASENSCEDELFLKFTRKALDAYRNDKHRGGHRLRAAAATFETLLCHELQLRCNRLCNCVTAIPPTAVLTQASNYVRIADMRAGMRSTATPAKSERSAAPDRTRPHSVVSSSGKNCDERKSDTFAAKLYGLLKQLSPDRRRQAIASELSQQQRLKLERWMLARNCALGCITSFASSGVDDWLCQRSISCSYCARLNSAICETSQMTLGAHIWAICENKGYSACVHLGHNLYAQSSRCQSLVSAVRAFSALLCLRARCRIYSACHEEEEAMIRFREGVTAAIADLRQASRSRAACALNSCGLSLRVRVSLARDVRVSTPLRKSSGDALVDWQSFQTDKLLNDILGGRNRQMSNSLGAVEDTCKYHESIDPSNPENAVALATECLDFRSRRDLRSVLRAHKDHMVSKKISKLLKKTGAHDKRPSQLVRTGMRVANTVCKRIPQSSRRQRSMSLLPQSRTASDALTIATPSWKHPRQDEYSQHV